MEDNKHTVYLSDVETPPSHVQDTSRSPSATQESNASASASNPSTRKRQLTLSAMFTTPQSTTPGQPKAKKTKLDTSTQQEASSGLQRLNFIPFSSSEFVDSIPEDRKHLLKLECECMGKSWLKLLKEEIKKPYFISLKKFLWEEGVRGPDDDIKSLKVYPARKFPALISIIRMTHVHCGGEARNIYSWSNTPLGKVKVVIVGQDPYHGPNQAHGLCFSVPKGVNTPPSLRNIYTEIKTEYPEFKPPKHGIGTRRNLSVWAENGVLMLNTCLTVKANQAGSHSGKGWEQFTDKVVDVGRQTKHLILTSAVCAWLGYLSILHLRDWEQHPSPLSANKGFLGNGHFKAANDWLEKKYGAEGKVNWCQLDAAA
ncbi:uracil-DNA glycosylase-like protein [Chiua virens]|nr:uracil-DNA glycosylase-like protein [Chiua virens]